MKHLARFRRPFSIFFSLCTLVLLSTSSVFAQSLDDLNNLKGHKASVFYSSDNVEQAEKLAKILDDVMSYYNSLINFEPTVTLLVLSPDDWNKYTTFPIYGMPHYNNQTLIVAAEDNDFWKSFILPLDLLPADLAQQIINTYSHEDGTLSMRVFFDLLAIHELGHAYHIQGGLKMQRLWMGELFSNLFLHTYIAEMEPDLLQAMTVFPEMVLATTNKDDLKFTTLQELESNYQVMGQQYPNNYGWYQCRWLLSTGEIYDESGTDAIKRLWLALIEQQESIDDTEFAKLLSEKVHQSVADVYLKWDDYKCR